MVFWHMSGKSSMDVPLEGGAVRLMAELGNSLDLQRLPGGIRIPLESRMYLECGVPRETVVRAFRNAKILV